MFIVLIAQMLYTSYHILLDIRYHITFVIWLKNYHLKSMKLWKTNKIQYFYLKKWNIFYTLEYESKSNTEKVTEPICLAEVSDHIYTTRKIEHACHFQTPISTLIWWPFIQTNPVCSNLQFF